MWAQAHIEAAPSSILQQSEICALSAAFLFVIFCMYVCVCGYFQESKIITHVCSFTYKAKSLNGQIFNVHNVKRNI